MYFGVKKWVKNKSLKPYWHLTYGWKTWRMTETVKRKLEAVEMDALGKLASVPRGDTEKKWDNQDDNESWRFNNGWQKNSKNSTKRHLNIFHKKEEKADDPVNLRWTVFLKQDGLNRLSVQMNIHFLVRLLWVDEYISLSFDCTILNIKCL